VESSFGEWVKASSIDNPDAKEYRQRKSALMRHALSRLSQPPYDHHESRNTYYQPSHCSIVQVVRIWRLVRRFHAKRHPPSPLRKPSLARLAIESGNARRIVAIGRHQRKATVRGKFYKGNGMYGPDVLIETDASEAVVDGAATRIQSSFRAGLDRLRIRRARAAGQAVRQRDEQLTRERYRFLARRCSICALGRGGGCG
jgi:hypothetical protein